MRDQIASVLMIALIFIVLPVLILRVRDRMTRGFEAVAFATTDMGDSIYLRPGSSEVNSVYLTHHDGGDTEVLAATLDEMVDTLRRSGR